MALVVPNAEEVRALTAWIGASAPWSLRLFGNNATPAVGSVVGDFTEIAGAGYAAISLPSASWGYTPGVPTVALYPAQTFTFTGAINAPGTIYGYFILNAAGQLVTAERLAAPPFTPTVNGDSVIVVPRITLVQA
jgi:hypothetical protein